LILSRRRPPFGLAQDAYLRRGPDCSRELPTRNRRWMYSSDAWQRSCAGGPTELSARNTNSARRYRPKGVNDLRHLAFCTYSHSHSRYRGTGKDEKGTSEMIIMEAILSASTPLYRRAAQSVGRSVERTFKRWWAVYTAWHREQRAMAELLSMSDRDLRDIGINRCEILRAVRSDTPRERTSV
jgi:uncharacterized protein YjiS (DUF1127 family)